jgi:hypothetical protein
MRVKLKSESSRTQIVGNLTILADKMKFKKGKSARIHLLTLKKLFIAEGHTEEEWFAFFNKMRKARAMEKVYEDGVHVQSVWTTG